MENRSSCLNPRLPYYPIYLFNSQAPSCCLQHRGRWGDGRYNPRDSKSAWPGRLGTGKLRLVSISLPAALLAQAARYILPCFWKIQLRDRGDNTAETALEVCISRSLGGKVLERNNRGQVHRKLLGEAAGPRRGLSRGSGWGLHLQFPKKQLTAFSQMPFPENFKLEIFICS